MTERPYGVRDEPRDTQSNKSSNESEGASAADDQVGPGHPPRSTQWKKGAPSPNPRGRPRKNQSEGVDVRKAFERALNKKVTVTRGGKKVRMTRPEAGFEQLFNQLAAGDPRARRDVLQYAKELGIDLLAPYQQAIEEALTPNHQAIVDSFLARRTGAASVAPEQRVLAPADLLEDEEAESDPSSKTQSASLVPEEEPKPVFVPPPDPLPKPGVKYPKPVERMQLGEKRAWYPEWYEGYAKEYQEYENKLWGWKQKRRARRP
jgi:Family of unknown function (DUF5681)